MNILFENAWAQSSGSGGTFLGFLPLVVIFVVFYFLLIRPQSKKQKEHKEMISSLVVAMRLSLPAVYWVRSLQSKNNTSS